MNIKSDDFLDVNILLKKTHDPYAYAVLSDLNTIPNVADCKMTVTFCAETEKEGQFSCNVSDNVSYR